MNNIKRRSFLKLISLGAILSYLPRINAQILSTDNDVQLIRHGHKFFNVYRRLFNKRLNFNPKIIALCKTELGVQKAIKYANDHALAINIKSGGHSFEGFSLNNDGMVIDLSSMNDLVLDDKHRLVAEPAVRLAQLYGYCLPKGRLLPSGSCASVGLSGITLGGGYGLFSRQFGLTCDYLTGVKMVNAQGDIIDSDDLPELLWACRGAGNGNFGVITQLRFDTVVAPKTLYQHRFRAYKLTPQRAVTLAKLWFEQCNNLPTHAFSAFVLNRKTLTVMITATEHDPEMKELLSNFGRFMDKNDNLNPDPIEIGILYYYGHSNALNFKNISAGYYKDFSDIAGCAERIFTKVANTPGAIFQINTLGGAINTPLKPNESAYAHRDANYLGEAQCSWGKSDQMAPSMEAMHFIQDTLYANGVKKHYVNYPDINIQNYADAYYGNAYARLQKLKKTLDPTNRFTYQQSISGD